MTTTAQKRSIRHAYGQTLVELGEADPRIVVLDADMTTGTVTFLFRDKFPNRFFDVGIAEQNLVAAGAGFALGGHIPFVNTFAYLFSLRAAEQVRSCVCLANTNVKIAAGYCGLSGALDGASHFATTDIATIRSFPNITVISVSDAVMAAAATRAMAAHDGPVYLRMPRADVFDIHPADFAFEIGKGITLRPGKDVTLIGTGVVTARCLQAADILAQQGVDARVLEIHTIKPIDEALIQKAAEETGALVTVEEHTIIGGLGAAVTEVLAARCPIPVVRVGINDAFCESGTYEQLLDAYGLSVEDIVAAAGSVKRLCQR